MIVASYGLRSYHAITEQVDQNFIGRTSLTYIATKVRQASVSNIEVPAPNMLVLIEEFGGIEHATSIFVIDGQLIETFGRHEPNAPVFTTTLTNINSFEAEFIADDLIKITLEDNFGRLYSIVAHVNK